MSLELRPDAKQFAAVVLMVTAIGVLSAGEVAWGLGVIGLAVVVSIGGMFYDAHRADLRDAQQQRSEADRSAAADRTH